VDDAGKLQIREDVYGRDQALLAILKDENQRKNADQAIERREISEKPAVARLPQENSFFGFFNRQDNMRRQDPRFGGRRSASDDTFFNRMFR
jgi:hypothetical protein